MTTQTDLATDRAVETRPGWMLPGEYYISAEIFARERERIFYGDWLCAGRASQISRPGSYVVLRVGEESILVLRDRVGGVRAFYNHCRHRGSLLCEAAAGQFSETIQCPYHAWTYALDGHLLGTPHAPDCDKSALALHGVAAEEWEGMLFVNLSRQPTLLEDELAAVWTKFDRWNLPTLGVGRRIEYDVRANWKLLVQNYSECLHCPPVHPALAKLSPYTSGQNDLQSGPVLGGYMELNDPDGSLTTSGRRCGIPVGDFDGEDHGRIYYYTLFPNLFLSLHPDYAMTHVLWPEAPDRTRVVCEWLFHPDSLAQLDFDPSDAVDFWDVTNRQDWRVCEMSQAGVSSRAFVPGPYSPRESMLAAFDEHYRKRMDEGE